MTTYELEALADEADADHAYPPDWSWVAEVQAALRGCAKAQVAQAKHIEELELSLKQREHFSKRVESQRDRLQARQYATVEAIEAWLRSYAGEPDPDARSTGASHLAGQ